MATGADVLSMLCPNTEWTIYDNDYDSILWIKGEQITKEQFEAGFAKFDNWQAEQNAKVAADKAALLQRLGISADEAALLLQ